MIEKGLIMTVSRITTCHVPKDYFNFASEYSRNRTSRVFIGITAIFWAEFKLTSDLI